MAMWRGSWVSVLFVGDTSCVHYTDRRPMVNALAVAGAAALVALVLWRAAAPVWGAACGVAGLVASWLVFRRSDAQTWRVANGELSVTCGDDTETLRLADVVTITAWEYSDSLQELFFARRDERGIGVPLHTVVLISAIGEELRSGGFTPTMDEASSELLGFTKSVGGR